jgi:hydroxypyruvate isomerase
MRHSVSQWCFPRISLADLAMAARSMHIESIELLEPADWPVVQRIGLTCAMARGPDSIADSFNRRENHERLVPAFHERLRECARAGLPNLICFSGNRHGRSDEEGLEVCTEGLKQVVGIAEQEKVTLCMELLNSKLDHPDYQCDHTAWGVELCRRVGSERFKLLYDIYHMQIMEGDVIRTIQASHPYIAHYHTAGNPGRGEIDDTQELNYPAIMRAIAATGYSGFIGQEFIPKRDPLRSLSEAIALCSV